VLSYVDGCDVYQKGGKAFPEMPCREVNNAKSYPKHALGWIFLWILLWDYQKPQGYNAILVVCDRFTKQVHIIPTMKETNSLGLARLYQDHIWKLHGLPNMVISKLWTFSFCIGIHAGAQ